MDELLTLPFEQERYQALLKLASERYGGISEAEKKVLRRSASTDDSDPGTSYDMESPFPGPEVGAAFLRWLSTDKEAARHIDPLGVRAVNATISNYLDLESCKIPFPLRFDNCRFRDVVRLRRAELPRVYMYSCRVDRGIQADGLITTAGVFLRPVISDGEIVILNAQIGGDLNCIGANLLATGNALWADGAKIAGSVFLRDRFSSAGTISLIDTTIGGILDCGGATLTARKTALNADRARITGSVILNREFSSAGEIHLRNAQIGGDLDWPGARLLATGNALVADGAKIAGSVLLRDHFLSVGTISIIDATIGDILNCDGALLTATGRALTADGLKISRNVLLTGRFRSAGGLSFLSAEIGGDLNCTGATLTATGVALNADGVKVTGSALLHDHFSSAGEIRFANAKIGGNLECDCAALTASGTALDAEQARVGGQIFLREGFSSIGAVSLASVEAATLNCNRSAIAHLDCTRMRLTGDFYWTEMKPPQGKPPHTYSKSTDTGELRLTGAVVATLHDDLSSWPAQGSLHLQDFVYQDLTSGAAQTAPTASERIVWLKRQPENEQMNAQPWMQLAKVLKDAGEEDDAKLVIYEYNRVLVKHWNWSLRASTWVVDQTQKQPLCVAVPIAALTALGSLVFWRAHRMRAMVPTDKDARTQFETKQPLPNTCPPFNPVVYSLENVLPVIKLGQDSAWTPNTTVRPYPFFAIVRGILIIFGWVLAGILTYAIAQRFEH
jgi:hypothetical protein